MNRESPQRFWLHGRNYFLPRRVPLPRLWRDRAVSLVKPGLSIIGIIYIIAIQLPLMSEYRPVIIDEFLIADSSYALASGETKVPAMKSWEHIIPEFGTINFHYPPVYLYLSAFAFKVLGLSAMTTGILHAVLRLLSALFFFLIAKRWGHTTFISIILTAVWATFAHAPVGRPGDLAVLLLVAAVLLLSGKGELGLRFVSAGICLGILALTHPVAIAAAVPCVILILWINSPGEIKRIMMQLGALGSVVGIVSLLWLIWIIPYWPEFKRIFIDFVLRDAATPSYTQSLRQFVREAVSGKWCDWAFPVQVHLFRFQFSLIPIVSLISYIVVYRVRNRMDKLIILLTIGFIPLLCARERYISYHMTWMNVYLVILLGLLGTRKIIKENGWFGGTRPIVPWFIVSLVAVQVLGNATGQAKQIVNMVRLNNLHPAPLHAASLKAIPANEKVILNDAYVFYRLRSKNPIFWPAGLRGVTTTGLPFEAHYDSSFRWMILNRPLSEDKNPGLKFAWDLKSWHWFRDNFELYKKSKVDPFLAGYLGKLPEVLYIYIRRARSRPGISNTGPAIK